MMHRLSPVSVIAAVSAAVLVSVGPVAGIRCHGIGWYGSVSAAGPFIAAGINLAVSALLNFVSAAVAVSACVSVSAAVQAAVVKAAVSGKCCCGLSSGADWRISRLCC